MARGKTKKKTTRKLGKKDEIILESSTRNTRLQTKNRKSHEGNLKIFELTKIEFVCV